MILRMMDMIQKKQIRLSQLLMGLQKFGDNINDIDFMICCNERTCGWLKTQIKIQKLGNILRRWIHDIRIMVEILLILMIMAGISNMDIREVQLFIW